MQIVHRSFVVRTGTDPPRKEIAAPACSQPFFGLPNFVLADPSFLQLCISFRIGCSIESLAACKSPLSSLNVCVPLSVARLSSLGHREPPVNDRHSFRSNRNYAPRFWGFAFGNMHVRRARVQMYMASMKPKYFFRSHTRFQHYYGNIVQQRTCSFQV